MTSLSYLFSFFTALQFLAHAGCNVVVDDGIQLFVDEAAVLGEETVYLIDDGF
jgi:hypothetical protein